MKLKSKKMFIDMLERDTSWRMHELSAMGKLVGSAKGDAKHTVIRASVVMLYSHWEGHIKHGGKLYISYLNFLGLKYGAMKRNNLSVALLSKFYGDFQVKNFYLYERYVDFLMDKISTEKFSVDSDKLINTRSNLQFEVLCEILAIIGMDDGLFMANKILIDEQLLKYRNCIAHGEDTRKIEEVKLDEKAYCELHARIVELMAIFDGNLSNHVLSDSFRKTIRVFQSAIDIV